MGGGECGALMRAMDWSQTPLGPVQDWPQSLRTAVSICLHSRFELLIWWGPEFTMLYNDAYCRSLAAKHPWALGKPGELVWKEIWDVIGPMLRKVVDTGEATWSDDLQLLLERHGYPEETFYTFSYSPILDEDGRIAGIFSAVSNTSEKVIGERRLRTLRDLAARAIETKSESDAWKTAAEVIGENEYDVAFAVLYELAADGRLSVAARTGIAADHPFCPTEIELGKSSEVLAGLLRQTIGDGAVEVSEADQLGFDLPGGAWKVPPRELILVPLSQTGQNQPLGVLVAGVSRRKLLDDSYRTFFKLMAGQIAKGVADAQAFENERKRAEALAELDRAKTTFFSNVSHEFRTPLTLMLAPLEDTLQNPSVSLPEKEREQLNIVHRNGLRLLKLVNTLLEFSRIEAGRMHAVYQPTDLCAVTTELAGVFRSAVERAGLKLVVQCDQLEEPVYVDRDMWEKIVLNLLSNAFKFTFEGAITVSLREHGEQVELTVQDTGTGIPAQELPRLFERFHRVEGVSGRTFEGTGIGLALVQELAKLHGGSVLVESEVGKGSMFTVTIPKGKAHLPADRLDVSGSSTKAQAQTDSYVEEALRWVPDTLTPSGYSGVAQEKTGPIGARDSAAQGRIVFADDNTDMRDYVYRLLAERYDVTAVANGQQALDAALKDPPDLILSDIMMPVMDGFELLRQVRENKKIASTPVILLSARAGEESRVEGLQSGADDYLVKPFTARELLARVGAHVNMARMRREGARREAKLREAAELERRRLRELFVHAPAAVGMTYGPEHRVAFMNPPYLRLLGRNEHGDYSGMPLREVVPEIAEQGIFELFDEVYRTGKTYSEHERKARLNRYASGQPETGYFDFVLQPAFNVNGGVEGILIHVTEVTQQVLARQEVEKREQLLQIAQRAAKAGSFEWNIETGELHWTPDYYDLHGVPRSVKPSYDQWLSLVHPEDREQADARVQETLRDRKEILENEYRVEAGGTERWIATHGRIFYDADEKPQRLVGISLDVTQRKKSEDALRRTEKLAATGRLAASIAHEINNPLEAVTNLLFLISRSDLNDEARRYLEMAENELTRVGNIATQTLRFYRQSYASMSARIPELLDSVLNVYQSRLLGANVKVVREYREVEELRCMAGEIRQVIANLIGNALDAMGKGGTLRLRIHAGHSAEHGGDGIRLVVADTGSGISSDVLPRIFEPFVTTKEATGTGLGLWVSSEIVQKHGGHMQVRSCAMGKKTGTVFSVFLPYAGGRAASVTAVEGAA